MNSKDFSSTIPYNSSLHTFFCSCALSCIDSSSFSLFVYLSISVYLFLLSLNLGRSSGQQGYSSVQYNPSRYLNFVVFVFLCLSGNTLILWFLYFFVYLVILLFCGLCISLSRVCVTASSSNNKTILMVTLAILN